MKCKNCNSKKFEVKEKGRNLEIRCVECAGISKLLCYDTPIVKSFVTNKIKKYLSEELQKILTNDIKKTHFRFIGESILIKHSKKELSRLFLKALENYFRSIGLRDLIKEIKKIDG